MGLKYEPASEQAEATRKDDERRLVEEQAAQRTMSACPAPQRERSCVCVRERVCVCERERVCACVRERERESVREREKKREREGVCLFV